MHAHMLTYSTHSLSVSHTHTHTLYEGKDRRIHQSLSHTEGGSLKEAVSFLSLPVPLLLSLSSISLSVTPHPSSVVNPLLSLFLAIQVWPDLPWIVFLSSAGQQGRRAGCYQTRHMAGSSLRLETPTGANLLTRLVTVAAHRSTVGSSLTTSVTPPMIKDAHYPSLDRRNDSPGFMLFLMCRFRIGLSQVQILSQNS